jgi:hypothetical protein
VFRMPRVAFARHDEADRLLDPLPHVRYRAGAWRCPPPERIREP